MLRCSDCGEKFTEDDADKRRETIDSYAGDSCYGYFFICPICGSEDVSEVAWYEDDEEEEE